MSQFKVYQDYCLNSTLVSNSFIDDYMDDANDAQIKIYLYLLRVLCAHKSCSISDLADKFNYTEKDVQRALKYWEKKGLILLEYDDNRALVGVRLLDFDTNSVNRNFSLAPVVPLPVKNDNPVVQLPVRNDYSLDDIASYKSRSTTEELICVVEQYLGKTLSPTNIKSLMYIQDELGFSVELIDYLFEYCVGRGKKDFRYIEKVALGWHEEGITTPKMAANASKKYEKEIYEVMKLLGKSNTPTQKEIDFITRWTKDFDFDMEIIAEACSRTVMATDSHRFEYADKILVSWHNLKVHHKSDIEAIDSQHSFKKVGVISQGKASSPQYKQFTHRDSEYSDLERELLSN